MVEEEVQPVQEEAPKEVPAPQEVTPEEEGEEGLPFPRARIVKLMKEEIGTAKQIRSEVKDAVNIWLGNLLKKISREMGNTQFGSVGMADFLRATKPYDMISDIIKDEERLRLSVEKLSADAQHILRELERFFATIKGEPQTKV